MRSFDKEYKIMAVNRVKAHTKGYLANTINRKSQRRQKQYANHCYKYIRTRSRQGTGVLFRNAGLLKKQDVPSDRYFEGTFCFPVNQPVGLFTGRHCP